MSITSVSRSFNGITILLSLIVILTLSGCDAEEVASTQENNNNGNQQLVNSNNTNTNTNTNQIMNLPQLKGRAIVVMKVNGKSIKIELDGDNAPITAGNFVDLVQKGVYNGSVFHRVVREPQPFVVQGGDPNSTDPKFPVQRLGTGSYVDPTTNNARYIPLEIRPAFAEGEQPPEIIYSQTTSVAPQLKHEYGVIAMARSQNPDSASAQFYFTLADLPFLDGSYAVFGKVLEGMDVVNKIQQGDRIESAEVIEGAENLTK
jgi:peptidyl-prolyl cis-trans isomerase B (cyclophilin B)